MRFVLGCCLWLVALPAFGQSSLEGAWSPETYTLKDGSSYELSGLIFFTAEDWTVLMFVKDEAGEVRRGSGEGGTYTLEGDALTFSHHFHLSQGQAMGSMDEAPLRMLVREASEGVAEPCTIELDGDALTIHFPSGNRIDFSRSS